MLELVVEHELGIGQVMVLVHFAWVDLAFVPVGLDLVGMDCLPFGYRWHSSFVDVDSLVKRIDSS